MLTRRLLIVFALGLAACGSPTPTAPPITADQSIAATLDAAVPLTATALAINAHVATSTSPFLPPTWTPQSGAPTDGPLPSLTPSPANAATPTAEAGSPEVIQILSPAMGSAVTSPVLISGVADGTFEQNIVVRITDEAGNILTTVPTTIVAELGQRGPPAEGSALARAILSHLLDRRVTTMVTTHHPELKIYSVETPGVRNASVEFDLETLAPTYRLVVGLPGRSNALAIARRLGLRDDIIEIARRMVATEDLIADDLLEEINRTRDNIRRQNSEATAIRQQLKEERDNLQARLDKIEDERGDIINTTRCNVETDLADIQKEIKRLRNDLRSAGLPLETLRAIQTAAERLAQQNSAPVQNVTEAVERPDWRPRLGDTVSLATLNTEGVVSEVSENEVLVQVGKLRVRADLGELSKRDPSQKRQIKRGQAPPDECDVWWKDGRTSH